MNDSGDGSRRRSSNLRRQLLLSIEQKDLSRVQQLVLDLVFPALPTKDDNAIRCAMARLEKFGLRLGKTLRSALQQRRRQSARYEGNRALRGQLSFCTTEEQIDQALEIISDLVSPPLSTKDFLAFQQAQSFLTHQGVKMDKLVFSMVQLRMRETVQPEKIRVATITPGAATTASTAMV